MKGYQLDVQIYNFVCWPFSCALKAFITDPVQFKKYFICIKFSARAITAYKD